MVLLHFWNQYPHDDARRKIDVAIRKTGSNGWTVLCFHNAAHCRRASPFVLYDNNNSQSAER